MWIANTISMDVQKLSVIPSKIINSSCVHFFETEYEATTWLGGVLSHELDLKMRHCDRLVSAIEQLQQRGHNAQN